MRSEESPGTSTGQRARRGPERAWWEEALLQGRTVLWRWDEATGAFEAAGALERLLGATPRSLDDLEALVHEEDRVPRRAALARAMEHGEPWTCTFRSARGDPARWIEERGAAERDGADQPSRVSALLVDVSRRKVEEAAADQRLRREHRDRHAAQVATDTAEAALRALARSEAFLESIFSSMTDGLVLFGPDGRITHMNPMAREILRFGEASPDESIEARAERLQVQDVEGRPIAPEQLPVPQALRGQVTRGLPVGLRFPDGRIVWVTAGAAPIRSPQGALVGAVLTLSDMSRLRELQEQREDLARMISHDLRTPLGVIAAQAKLLGRRTESPAAVRVRAEAIGTSAMRMAAMLSDLVESALIDSGKLRLEVGQVDLPEMARELRRRLAAPYDAERIQVEAGPDVPPVAADPARLERVLVNLFTNALKYSAPGSPVVVRISPAAGAVALEVEDRGQGIAEADLPHLFERYHRALGSHRLEGVGLGLWTARRLVEAHGGSIAVTSVPGQGSVFRVRLPAASPRPPPPPA
jgi:signal transduction histidine kinase